MALSSGMCLDKAALAWGGRAEGHRCPCSWLRGQGPVTVLHVINSEAGEVFLALMQNHVYLSGAKDTASQKVQEPSLRQVLPSGAVALAGEDLGILSQISSDAGALGEIFWLG